MDMVYALLVVCEGCQPVAHFLTWISKHMPSNMWDEITYPFLNFNGATVEV